ncbi:hypothetical protein D9M69_393220 [compost metagenome]
MVDVKSDVHPTYFDLQARHARDSRAWPAPTGVIYRWTFPRAQKSEAPFGASLFWSGKKTQFPARNRMPSFSTTWPTWNSPFGDRTRLSLPSAAFTT